MRLTHWDVLCFGPQYSYPLALNGRGKLFQHRGSPTMLRSDLNLSASSTLTRLVAEGYKALNARLVPVGGFVQLGSI